jgi:ubiquinol-cytochrome c reductase cytochrome b subunit
LGRTWTLAVVAPLGVVTMFTLMVLLYPFIEERITKDHREHNALERPRDAPTRTAVGVTGIVFYCILWAAAGADIIATEFHVSLESVIRFLQLCLLGGPPLALVLARAVCLGLQDRDREEQATGAATGHILRLPNGGYTELHRPVTGSSAHQPERPGLTPRAGAAADGSAEASPGCGDHAGTGRTNEAPDRVSAGQGPAP